MGFTEAQEVGVAGDVALTKTQEVGLRRSTESQEVRVRALLPELQGSPDCKCLPNVVFTRLSWKKRRIEKNSEIQIGLSQRARAMWRGEPNGCNSGYCSERVQEVVLPERPKRMKLGLRFSISLRAFSASPSQFSPRYAYRIPVTKSFSYRRGSLFAFLTLGVFSTLLSLVLRDLFLFEKPQEIRESKCSTWTSACSTGESMAKTVQN